MAIICLLIGSSYATDQDKWEDIASWQFMDVQWHHELWDRYLDRNTNVFHCAGNREVFKKLKQWREHPNSWAQLVLESYKEGNWSYGWNAMRESPPRGRQLGTVPEQENPVTLNLRTSNFADPDYGYVPWKESGMAAPANMFIVGDKAG